MARRPPTTGESARELTVSVVGYVETSSSGGSSGLAGATERDGGNGSGKSCLCSRFVRPLADEYEAEHSSILSAADFSGPVINNDQFLYWGSAVRTSDDGVDCTFNVVEQTEFVDDLSFQPFRGGKGGESYLKRCVQTKLQSAEKLMYVCRSQLGLEERYEKRSFPNGKVTVDGFVCVFDVSRGSSSASTSSAARRLARQVEFVSAVLNALVKTKKPVVLATTKNDGDVSETAMQEVMKLGGRKEYRSTVVGIVETSARLNVNVDTAFLLLAAADGAGGGVRPSRPKVLPYVEAARARAEVQAVAAEAYTAVLRTLARDYMATWATTTRLLANNPDYCHFVELHGMALAQRQYRAWMRQLRDEAVAHRRSIYVERLPCLLKTLLPDLTAIAGRSWTNCQRVLAQRDDFNEHFVLAAADRPWHEDDTILDRQDTRLPFDFLGGPESDTAFRNHLNALQTEQRRLEMRKQFRQLLEANPNVTAGKQLAELSVFFIGRDCYDQLSESDRREVYTAHQVALREAARRDLQELLYERSELFVSYDDPDTAVTQGDVESITEALRSDTRFRALARCEEDRKVTLLNHLCFLQYPVKEQCPFRASCMEIAIQNCLAAKAKRLQSVAPLATSWRLNPHEKNLNLVLLGSDNLSTELVQEIRAVCVDDQYIAGSVVHNLDYRPVDGDVSLPHNALNIPAFPANGLLCVYSSHDTLEYLKDALSKTLLLSADFANDNDSCSSLLSAAAVAEERAQYSDLPVVVVLAYDRAHTEKGLLLLRDEGRELAARLHSPFIDVPEDADEIDDAGHDLGDRTGVLFFPSQVQAALSGVLKQEMPLDATDGGDDNAVATRGHSDLRILMCLMCGDGLAVETMIQPIFGKVSCQIVSNDRYHVLRFETSCGVPVQDEKRTVEVLVASYHEASLLKDELCHGCILVYSVKRKASYSAMSTFASKTLDLPMLIVAHSDSVQSEMSATYADLGRLHAEKCHAFFATSSQFSQSESIPFALLVKDAWEQKQYTECALYSVLTPRGEGGGDEDDPRYCSDSLERCCGEQQLPPYSSPNGTMASSSGVGSSGRPAGSTATSSLPRNRLDKDTAGGDQMAAQQPPLPRKQWTDSKNSMYLGGHGDENESRDSSSNQSLPAFAGASQRHRKTLSSPQQERVRAPLAEMDVVEISDYAEPADALSLRSGDGDYALVQDALPAGRIQRVLSSFKQHPPDFPSQQLSPVYSVNADLPASTAPGSDRKGSSPSNGRRSSAAGNSLSTSPGTRRQDSLRSAVTGSAVAGSASWQRLLVEHNGYPAASALVPGVAHSTATMKSETPSESSDSPGDEHTLRKHSAGSSATASVPSGANVSHKRSFKLSRKRTDGAKDGHAITDQDSVRASTLPLSEQEGGTHRGQSFLERWKVGGSAADKEAERVRRQGEKKAKEDEKRVREDEKLRQKEEREKQKEARRKKSARRSNRKSYVERESGLSLQDYRQLENAIVPKFVEHCIHFIETEGLDSEGIYRVPGNGVQVLLLKTEFEKDKELVIANLQIGINAVATAVKQFFSDLTEPLVPRGLYDELTLAASIPDGSGRLLALRGVLKKLPPANHDVLGFLMTHLNKVAHCCEKNAMDSKNLAICWWPTLLRPQFASYEKMAMISKCLEEIVQTVIEQFGFFFFNENEV